MADDISLNIQGENGTQHHTPTLTELAKEHIAAGDLDKLDDQIIMTDAQRAARAHNTKPADELAARQALRETPEAKVEEKPAEVKPGEQPPEVKAAEGTPAPVEEKPIVPADAIVEPTEFEKYLQEKGGKDRIEKSTALYDTLTAPPGEFEASKFLAPIAEKFPKRYNAVVTDVFRLHGAEFMSNVMGISPETYQRFLEWEQTGGKVADAPAAEDDSDLDPADPKDAEILKYRQNERANAKRMAEYEANNRTAAQKQQAAAREAAQKLAMDKESDYETGTMQPIQDVIKTLESKGAFGKTPEDEEIKMAIFDLAQGNFIRDASAQAEYRKGLRYIRAGEPDLADELKANINARMGTHAVKAAQMFLGLLSAKRELEALKRGNANLRVEIPKTSSQPQPVTTAVNGATLKPFSKEANMQRLRELEASGRF